MGKTAAWFDSDPTATQNVLVLQETPLRPTPETSTTLIAWEEPTADTACASDGSMSAVSERTPANTPGITNRLVRRETDRSAHRPKALTGLLMATALRAACSDLDARNRIARLGSGKG